MSDGVLLDTHALIWIVLGEPIRKEAATVIVAASTAGGVHISAATAWELGIISQKRSLEVVIAGDVRGWLAKAGERWLSWVHPHAGRAPAWG